MCDRAHSRGGILALCAPAHGAFGNTRDSEALSTTSRERALQALAGAFTKNALQPVMIDVSEVTSYADYILILSGRSIRQVEAIAEAIEAQMKQEGHDPIGVEGSRGGQWMLLDYGAVVVHVFYHPIREYYDLEGLWADAPRVQLEVPPELQSVSAYGYSAG